MKYGIIHHSGVSHKTVPTQLWATNRYHQQKFGLLSSLGFYVAYNYFVESNGTITKTRQEGEEGTHTQGHNHEIAICFSGDLNTELPTFNQINSFKTLWEGIQRRHPTIEISTHRDLQANRTCPGSLLTTDYIDRVLVGKHSFEINEDTTKARDIRALASQLDGIRTITYNLQKLVAQLQAKN